jgi:hypothetical protein
MAAKLKVPVNEDRELDEISEKMEKMASMTTAVPKKEKKYQGPYVRIFLPELENSENEGLNVDQYEHVTLANETGEEHYRIHRGEYVDVPVPVFIVLKDRYPKL